MTTDWPHLTESFCPWCERAVADPRLTRLHDQAAEYACPDCGGRHVKKEGDPAT